MPSPPFSSVRRLFGILKFERREIVSIYFYAILAGLVQLALPLGIQSIISFVQAGSISTSLVLLICFVILSVALAGIFQVNVMKIIEGVQQQLFVRYALTYTETIPKLNLRDVDAYYLPELTNRFFDTATLQKGIGKLLVDVPAATIYILFGLILLCFYHPLFIFFGVVLVAVLILLFRISGNSGMRTSLEESDYKYRVASHLEELARVIASFKFIRNPIMHLQKSDELVTGYLDARTRHFHVLRLQYSALIIFKLLITAAMLIIGAVLLVNNLLSVGQFIASEIVILTVIGSVEKLIVNLDNVYDVLTAVEKISKITDKPLERDGDVPFEPAAGVRITARNLSFSHSKNEPLLSELSFDIPAGNKVALQGDFGSGKSTLLRILAGIHDGYSGRLDINGQPIVNYNSSTLRSRTGILLQHHADIFEGSLYDNICLGASGVSRQWLDQLAAIVGLKAAMEDNPEAYELQLKPAGEGLSGRMLRKIQLMRALVHRPELLLLEEPWLGLEPQYAQSIQDYLLEQMPGTTAIIVTADNQFAGRCNQVFQLQSGKLNVRQS